MLSDEEKKLKRRLQHNEAQRRSHKKLMGTEKNKKKMKERQKKPGNVFKGGLNLRLLICFVNRLSKKNSQH